MPRMTFCYFDMLPYKLVALRNARQKNLISWNMMQSHLIIFKTFFENDWIAA